MKLATLIIIATAALTGAAAHAETFNYSYTFSGGSVVTGSFDGTASGNLVTNLSHITVILNGITFNGSGSLMSSTRTNGIWGNGGAVASFDGRQNNFFFSDAKFPENGNLLTNYFYSSSLVNGSTQTDTSYARFASYVGFGGPYAAARWSLISAVPEPASYTLMLAGLGLFCAISRRRKDKKV